MKRVLITAILLIVATAVFAAARQDTKPPTMPDDAWNDDERIHDEQLADEHSGR